MDGQLDDEIKQFRQEDLMGVQAEISKDKNEALIGQEVKLLVDGPSEEHEWVQVGRMESQAPEVDGQVYIDNSDATKFNAGDFINVKITQAEQYDLAGVVTDG